MFELKGCGIKVEMDLLIGVDATNPKNCCSVAESVTRVGAGAGAGMKCELCSGARLFDSAEAMCAKTAKDQADEIYKFFNKQKAVSKKELRDLGQRLSGSLTEVSVCWVHKNLNQTQKNTVIYLLLLSMSYFCLR